MTCVIDGDWEVNSTLLAETMRTARKPHLCFECARKILPGERYEDARFAGDGTVWRYKTCVVCAEIRDALLCSWGYGFVWQDIAGGLDIWNGDWSRVPWPVVVTLSKPARDAFCDWLEEVTSEPHTTTMSSPTASGGRGRVARRCE